MSEAPSINLRECLSQFQAPIHDLQTLTNLLASSLAAYNILLPRYQQFVETSIPLSRNRKAVHLIPQFQLAILEQVLPNWEQTLERNDLMPLVQQWFCPVHSSSEYAAEVARHAFSSTLSVPLRQSTVAILKRLLYHYPLSSIYCHFFPVSGGLSNVAIDWDEYLKDIFSLPAKVANASGSGGIEMPEQLETRAYSSDLCTRTEEIIRNVSSRSHLKDSELDAIISLVEKLVLFGAYPQGTASLSQVSFFEITRQVIRSSLGHQDGQYATTWQKVLNSLSHSSIHKVLASWLSDLPLNSSDELGRSVIKSNATSCKLLFGDVSESSETWKPFVSTVVNHQWSENHARVAVCWLGLSDGRALEVFLHQVLDVWTSTEHVKYSLLAMHHYTTELLLLTISQFEGGCNLLQTLSITPSFVSAVSLYISHTDTSIRICGMLVAEEVAQRSGRKLDFKIWDGDGGGKDWARRIRRLINTRDIDSDLPLTPQAKKTQPDHSPGTSAPKPSSRVVHISNATEDSDDSLEAYADSSASSSRPPSPTMSELEEQERDATLRNPGKKRINNPVYLINLGQLLKVEKEGPEQAESVEIGLRCAAGLIRRKEGYGNELEENAVDLAYTVMGLQNNYEMDNFEKLQQDALISLVACCPKRVAPTIIEQFFTNQYSAAHRHFMLNALALGARELADLPTPPQPEARFPSKLLPSGVHEIYIDERDLVARSEQLLEGISRKAIEKGREKTEGCIPELTRERQLTIKLGVKRAAIVELNNDPNTTGLLHRLTPRTPTINVKRESFSTLAAEYFIGPLVNRFWRYLNDQMTREERTGGGYRGAGAGLILNPLILTHLVTVLAILMDAGRFSPAYLDVLGPGALELSITLATQRISAAEGDGLVNGGKSAKEASVLRACLQLALNVLDACLDLDGGRTLAFDQTMLLLGIGEWSESVFKALESGAKVIGGGGKEEDRLIGSAAGLALKVEEVRSKWRGRMTVSL